VQIEFKHRPDRDYKWEWYYSPQGKEFPAVMDWLWDTFGHPGSALGDGSWDCTGGWIKFKQQESVLLFVLRWSHI
jgi:hypothetical protein